jgi:L-malate glycosyltransferase
MTAGRLRVLYIIGSMGNGLAGTERNLLTIIRHLDRQKFEPFLITLQDCEFYRAGKFDCETLCWHCNRVLSTAFFAKRTQLVEFMREKAIDVVQTFFLEAHLLGGSAARKAGIKLVVSSRRNLGYSYGLKEKILLKIANRYPQRFLANSQAVANTIARVEGCWREQFDVIYNGVELSSRVPDERHQVNSVVMVANLRPVKSIPTLIKAAAIVAKEIPNVRFKIVGEGPDRHKLQGMINALKLQSFVSMPGAATDVHNAISTAAIGALTSSSEGFSNSLLEYMNAGLAIVATRVGGNDEIVQDGVNGYLVDAGDEEAFADCLLKLLREPELARSLGRAGRKLVEEQFSVEAMVRRHEEYYLTLTRGPRSS